MSIKSYIAKIWAKAVVKKHLRLHANARAVQENLLQDLLHQAANTKFGKSFQFASIKDYTAYKAQVKLNGYEALEPFVKAIIAGEQDVLWPGQPLYFAKTSGTSSGEKYIPISKVSIKHHINAARDALFFYITETGNTSFIDGKMIFLQGSPVLEKKGNIATGRLSGIVYHHVPAYLHRNRKPSYPTNCIEDWEEKVDAVVAETSKEAMTLISGIPPWLVMYFEKLIATNKVNNLSTLFPRLSLLIYGGVNFQPYQQKIRTLLGKDIDSIETYPASEGFIAFQDKQATEGMLLNLNAGIFYEFVEAKNFDHKNSQRLALWEVQPDTNYAIILSTDAGLWSYVIGDVIQFTSLKPYRIKVTGRLSQFVSAFGEHVIVEEIESSMLLAMQRFPCVVKEYTVAPQVNPASGLPYHEWLIEFERSPADLEAFATYLDACLQGKNVYYKDLVQGQVIRPLKLTCLSKDAFHHYLQTSGKLGGQHKVMRVRNDRNLADILLAEQAN